MTVSVTRIRYRSVQSLWLRVQEYSLCPPQRRGSRGERPKAPCRAFRRPLPEARPAQEEGRGPAIMAAGGIEQRRGNGALSSHGESEAGPRGGAATSVRGGDAGAGFRGGRRVPAQHGRGPHPPGWRGALGGGLFLPDAAARGAAVLGRLFRAGQGEGRARPVALPR